MKSGRISPDSPVESSDFEVPQPHTVSEHGRGFPVEVQEFLKTPCKESTKQDEYFFDVWCQIHAVEGRIKERELLRATNHAETDSRETALALLRAELARLNRLLNDGGASDAQSAGAPAPVVPDSASSARAWAVTKPQRYKGYTAPLHRLIAAAHREGKPRPTARDVLEAWRSDPPAEIAKVLTDGLDYYNASGNTKALGIDALRNAINRMTSDR